MAQMGVVNKAPTFRANEGPQAAPRNPTNFLEIQQPELRQINMKAVLATLQALEQATDHLPLACQVLQHPVGITRIDRSHVGPDLGQDRRQVIAAGIARNAQGVLQWVSQTGCCQEK